MDTLPRHDVWRVTEGGNLPHVDVTDLSLSIGNIDPNTGMPNLAGPYDPNSPTPSEATADPDVLLATTYGQGAFAINLAPMVFPAATALRYEPASQATPPTARRCDDRPRP